MLAEMVNASGSAASTMPEKARKATTFSGRYSPTLLGYQDSQRLGSMGADLRQLIATLVDLRGVVIRQTGRLQHLAIEVVEVIEDVRLARAERSGLREVVSQRPPVLDWIV